MRGVIGLIFAFVIAISPVMAAEIHGNIYDFSLNKIGNVIVEIDTAPKQFIVSKNGSYDFDVPIGVYEVKAQHYESGLLISSTAENITVKDDGEYILDLILFPVINEEELLEDEIKPSSDRYNLGFASLTIAFFIFIIIYYIYTTRKKKKDEKSRIEDTQRDEEEVEKKEEIDYYGEGVLEKVIEIIKDEGGRTTQKEIRKKIPLSEAKISLIITQLESEGKLKKIKKGRGNIIILN